MDYNSLKFKKQFIGKTLHDQTKSIVMTDDLSMQDKRYIFNMITLNVFDIFTDEEIIVDKSEDKETQLIEVKLDNTDIKDKEVVVKKPRAPRKKKA